MADWYRSFRTGPPRSGPRGRRLRSRRRSAVPAWLRKLDGPDLRSADERVRSRRGDAALKQIEDDGSDVVERRPFAVWPAAVGTDRGEMILREHEIGVGCRIEVAEAVPHEHRVVTRSLVEHDPLALARTAHPARRVAVREVDGHPVGREVRSGRVDRQISEPDPLE